MKRRYAPQEKIMLAVVPISIGTHCVSRPRPSRQPKSKGNLLDNPWVELALLAIFSTVGSSFFKYFMPGET